MAYNLTRTDGTFLVSVPDNQINNTATSLSLIGRNAVNFGLALDENFIGLLQNWSNSYAPNAPLPGQLWYDSGNQFLKIYNGTSWKTVVPPFDGASGTATVKIGPLLVDAAITLAQNKIIFVCVYDRLQASDLPEFVVINDYRYTFAFLFPTGLYPGINLPQDPGHMLGVYGMMPRNIQVTGTMHGNVMLDNSSNVNLSISFNNVYVGNTNVTVAGNWSKVFVSDGGQVIGGGNIVNSDVVNALGYVPYNGANISVLDIPNTVVARDQYGNFNANVISATTQFANALAKPVMIGINGDVVGAASFDGTSNVVIQSELATIGNLTAGTYNTVTVDNKGRVTAGALRDEVPTGSILLWWQAVVPTGWAQCDGRSVTLPDGSVATTPNLSNVYVNDANLHVYTTYVMKVFKDLDLPSNSGSPGYIEVDLQPGGVPNIEFFGGPNIVYPPLVYSGDLPAGASHAPLPFSEKIEFGNNLLFDATSVLLANGDINAIMFSMTDIFGDLSQLTIAQVIYNLQARKKSGLPPRLGKYMLSLDEIINYAGVLRVPVDTQHFTVAVQDSIMYLKVADIANRLRYAGIIASDDNIFTACYIGLQQTIALIHAPKTDLVGDILLKAGLSPTGNSTDDLLSGGTFLTACSRLISFAKTMVGNRLMCIEVANKLNAIAGKQIVTVPPFLISQPLDIINVSNILVQENLVDGVGVYFGGKIPTTPTYGGGAFINDPATNKQVYTDLVTSIYNPQGPNGHDPAPALNCGVGVDLGYGPGVCYAPSVDPNGFASFQAALGINSDGSLSSDPTGTNTTGSVTTGASASSGTINGAIGPSVSISGATPLGGYSAAIGAREGNINSIQSSNSPATVAAAYAAAGITPGTPVSSMTVGQVQSLQSGLLANKALNATALGYSAVGMMQITNATLDQAVKAGLVSTTDIFDKTTQQNLTYGLAQLNMSNPADVAAGLTGLSPSSASFAGDLGGFAMSQGFSANDAAAAIGNSFGVEGGKAFFSGLAVATDPTNPNFNPNLTLGQLYGYSSDIIKSNPTYRDIKVVDYYNTAVDKVGTGFTYAYGPVGVALGIAGLNPKSQFSTETVGFPSTSVFQNMTPSFAFQNYNAIASIFGATTFSIQTGALSVPSFVAASQAGLFSALDTALANGSPPIGSDIAAAAAAAASSGTVTGVGTVSSATAAEAALNASLDAAQQSTVAAATAAAAAAEAALTAAAALDNYAQIAADPNSSPADIGQAKAAAEQAAADAAVASASTDTATGKTAGDGSVSPNSQPDSPSQTAEQQAGSNTTSTPDSSSTSTSTSSNDSTSSTQGTSPNGAGGTAGDCHVPWAKITMADGTFKEIQYIQVGDKLQGYSQVNTVSRALAPRLDSRLVSFSGNDYFVSETHPMLTDKGWGAFNPQLFSSQKPNEYANVVKNNGGQELVQIVEGSQVVKMVDGVVSLVTVTDLTYEYRPNYIVYRLSVVGDHTYIAEGFVSHNKE